MKNLNKESCFLELLEKLKNNPSNTRDQGTNFENLVKIYLQNDIHYKDRFKNVWLWGEYPNKKSSDCGIDIIAEEQDGLCAIQCKFYQKDHRIEKKDVDTFLSESSKYGYTSRIIVSTTSNWSKKAEEALQNQNPPVTRIDYHTLANSSIDWCKYLETKSVSSSIAKKELRDHQRKAVEKTIDYFKHENRGKLIMACGTGKTFTSLKILEETVPLGGSALVLLPSLSLLSQTHKEWSEQASKKLRHFAVCSDNKIGKNEEDFSLVDLEIPATTNHKNLVKKAQNTSDSITVIYSTYHSIEVIKEAQNLGLAEFNLVICDEAHRTTGIEALNKNKEGSAFVKIHDENYVKAQKRLYMTATPKIYTEDSKKKADVDNLKIYSMDDEQKYGKEIYNLGFAEAVEKGLLTDYEVLVLLVDDVQINKLLASLLDENKNALTTNEVVKIIGCRNGLKGEVYDLEGLTRTLNKPLKRAISFTNTIEESKAICEKFKIVIDALQKDKPETANFESQFNHIDGTMNALQRKEKLSWLKGDYMKDYEARILSNARCLSEGVDVPSLDAILFLQPRKSQVDIIQAVGRVMRKAEGKDKGYIIIPIVVVPNVKPEEALASNPEYQTIWNVVNALKSHDPRLEAELNLNNTKKIKVGITAPIGRSKSYPQDVNSPQQADFSDYTDYFSPDFLNTALDINNKIKTTIVKKNSSPEYWRYWAQDVAHIAQSNTERIKDLISTNSKAKKAFNSFLNSLHKNINSSISTDEAVEMLSQHIITQPVFNALFENHKFTSHNAISKEMQAVLKTLEKNMLDNTNEKLKRFYDNVKLKAKSAKTQADQQHLILSLYDNFFKTAFPKMAQRLGIVYTPVEIVDFIIHSVEHVLKTEFNSSLSNEKVNILDPFTGTGTFITRLLQSGLIKKEDLKRKYQSEIHANEIILLAYYIAAVNIEMAYHYLAKEANQENIYIPFNKIVLTDTFNLNEKETNNQPTQQFLEMDGLPLEENNELRHEQIKLPIQVIIGNPPYSSGQRSENDNNKNIKYPLLDESIKNTYVKNTLEKGNKNSLYDSYIRAFRWATNKLLYSIKTESNQKNSIQGGVIGFVTNGSFIDSNAMDGFRNTLTKEFDKIYVFNLKGNFRKFNKAEGQNVFGNHAGTTISITLLIKNPSKNLNNQLTSKLFYYEIADGLKKCEKLHTIKTFKSIANIPWQTITPNKKHDWINQRNNFEYEESFTPLGDKKNITNKQPIFNNYSCGLKSNRDSWVYNFSKQKLTENMQKTINFYNSEVNRYQQELANLANTNPNQTPNINIDKFVNNDPTKIGWSNSLKDYLKRKITVEFNKNNIVISNYRPFCKQFLYYNKHFNEGIYLLPKTFPTTKHPNVAIGIPGRGNSKIFTPFIINILPDYCVLFATQWFPLYTYKPVTKQNSLNIHGNHNLTPQNITNSLSYYTYTLRFIPLPLTVFSSFNILFNQPTSYKVLNNTYKQPIFNNYSCGLKSNRDSWVYNFSKQKLTENMQKTINFYNSEVNRYQQELANLANTNSNQTPNINIDKFVNNDSTKISWSSSLKDYLKRKITVEFNKNNIVVSNYRPFCKQFLYYNKYFNHRTLQIPQTFPTPKHPNIAIGVIGKGSNKNFSPFITNIIPDLEVVAKSQWFPLYTYKPVTKQISLNIHGNHNPTLQGYQNATPNTTNPNTRHNYQHTLNTQGDSNAYNNLNTTLNSSNCTTNTFTSIDNNIINSPKYNNSNYNNSQNCNNFNNSDYEGYTREDNITDYTLKQFQDVYNNTSITKEDIFYYIYGLLHSKDYANKYADYLKKEIPKIPYAENFAAFAKAGRDLAYLHLNYETLPESKDVTVIADFPKTALIKRTDKKDTVNKYITTKEELQQIEEHLMILEGLIPEKSTPSKDTNTTNSSLNHIDESTLLKYNDLQSLLDTEVIDPEFFKVNRIKFYSKDDKSIINFNHYITIKNIPLSAYEYIVNGKSAIDWIVDRYQYTVHKDSVIKNDPNTYSDDPKYVLKLLLKIIYLSVESVNIINSLPPLIVKDIK